MLDIFIHDKNLFEDSTFKRIAILDAEGIKAITAKRKANISGAIEIIAYSFPVDKWDADSAQEWIDEHGKSAEWTLGHNYSETLERAMPMNNFFKQYDSELKSFDDEKRSFEAIASSEAIDRDGDILTLDGWDFKNFKKNPVLLWAHDAYSLPIGKVADVWIDGKFMKFRPEFMSKELNPFAEQVYQMYKAGFLRSFSVRFDPSKWEDITPEKTPKQGEIVRYGRRYLKKELLEISCVNIPANPQAIKSAPFQHFVLKTFSLQHKIEMPDIKEEAQQELKQGKQPEQENVSLTRDDITAIIRDEVKAAINAPGKELISNSESDDEIINSLLEEIEKIDKKETKTIDDYLKEIEGI